MALPRLVSEYFAARAQSDALISAKAAGDVVNMASNNPLYLLRRAKRDSDECFIRRSRRPQGDGYRFVVAGGDLSALALAEADGAGPPESLTPAAGCATGK